MLGGIPGYGRKQVSGTCKSISRLREDLDGWGEKLPRDTFKIKSSLRSVLICFITGSKFDLFVETAIETTEINGIVPVIRINGGFWEVMLSESPLIEDGSVEKVANMASSPRRSHLVSFFDDDS